MKKLIALVMAMMLAFSCAAFAEEEIVLEVSYDAVLVEMDYGTGIYVPSDWYMAELSEEQIEKGIFAFFTNEDMTETLQISIGAITEGITYESLYAQFSELYSDVAIVELPNAQVLTYADYDNGLMAALTIDEANGLLYTMNFLPYSPEFALLATEILCTFGYIAVEE